MRKSNDNVNYQADPTPPADKALGDEVLDLVHRVMHQVRSQQYQALRGSAGDVTHMESKVLGFVGRQPGCTQSDIAQHSGRDKAQLARLIKALRERGLLDAEAAADDRRSLQLRLTEAGQGVLQHLRQQTLQLGARAVTGLSAAEQQQLLQLMQRVQQNLGPAEAG